MAGDNQGDRISRQCAADCPACAGFANHTSQLGIGNCLASGYFSTGGQYFSSERRKIQKTEGGGLRTESGFSGKIGDYLFLQGLQEAFVKLGAFEASEEVFFNSFAVFVRQTGANKPLLVGG